MPRRSEVQADHEDWPQLTPGQQRRVDQRYWTAEAARAGVALRALPPHDPMRRVHVRRLDEAARALTQLSQRRIR